MRGGCKLKREIADQIEMGDYLILKKDKSILICTNVLIGNSTTGGVPNRFWCFEKAGQKRTWLDFIVFDLEEMLLFKCTVIKKDSTQARNLELLYAKV